jgi:hypothetical protein
MESDKDGCLLSAVKMENEPKKPIRLLSPSGGDKIAYNWKDETAFSIGLEIRETIK